MYSNGISFFENTNAVVYSASNVADRRFETLADINNNSSVPWSMWGDDNLKPVRMRDDILNCGVLSAGVQSKVRMAIGQGLRPFLKTAEDSDGKETLTPVTDKEIVQWFEMNRTYNHSFVNIYNMIGYGWGCTQFLLNNAGNKINRIKATDVFTARLEKKSTRGISEKIYLCSDWEAVSTYDKEKVKEFTLLEEGFELEDLQAANANKANLFEFGMLHRILLNGTQYYPTAIWEAAKEWVKISRSVPSFKSAINKNQMAIKYLILIDDNYWNRRYEGFKDKPPAEQEKIVKDKHAEINKWLTGEQNAGKTIIAGKYIDPYQKVETQEIEIKVIDDKWKDGKMLPDNAAADKQILFSMFLNPAIWGGNLLGDGASGGAGSGSDIREAFLVQIMMMHAERVMNAEVFNVVKYFNGWNRIETDSSQLVFRYPSGILTTLDKGGSTKPVNA